MRYDRALLLGGAKRGEVLDLWEVQRYGVDSYNDADYVSVYGMVPEQWYGLGVRLLGRTVVECTRDVLADAIGRDVAAVAQPALGSAGVLVVDPFVGSGNTLFWLVRHLPKARGVGFEVDDDVFFLTRRNFSFLDVAIELRHGDSVTGVTDDVVKGDELVIAFIAPPWGDALSKTGLDLRRTRPPVREIVDGLVAVFANRLLFAIQIFERVDPGSLAEVEDCFDWSTLVIYDLNAPGENHGVVLATRGWIP